MQAAASKRTVLATKTNDRGTTHSLVQIAAGWEVAGSGQRWTDAGYRVRWELRDGTNGSQFYKDEAPAREAFAEAGNPPKAWTAE